MYFLEVCKFIWQRRISHLLNSPVPSSLQTSITTQKQMVGAVRARCVENCNTLLVRLHTTLLSHSSTLICFSDNICAVLPTHWSPYTHSVTEAVSFNLLWNTNSSITGWWKLNNFISTDAWGWSINTHTEIPFCLRMIMLYKGKWIRMQIQ